jgi:hypothetical protein
MISVSPSHRRSVAKLVELATESEEVIMASPLFVAKSIQRSVVFVVDALSREGAATAARTVVEQAE